MRRALAAPAALALAAGVLKLELEAAAGAKPDDGRQVVEDHVGTAHLLARGRKLRHERAHREIGRCAGGEGIERQHQRGQCVAQQIEMHVQRLLRRRYPG